MMGLKEEEFSPDHGNSIKVCSAGVGLGDNKIQSSDIFVSGLTYIISNIRVVRVWNTVHEPLRPIPRMTVSPLQSLSHWYPLSWAVDAEGGHKDTGCPSCHPHSTAEGTNHCRKETSQHQAPESAASPEHGQTHELPLVGDQCLNRRAKKELLKF